MITLAERHRIKEGHDAAHERDREAWIAQGRYPHHMEKCYRGPFYDGGPLCGSCLICDEDHR